jgi:hypothetical protein
MDASHTNVDAAITQARHRRLNALMPNPIERTIQKNVMSFEGTQPNSVNGSRAQPFSAHRGKETRLPSARMHHFGDEARCIGINGRARGWTPTATLQF